MVNLSISLFSYLLSRVFLLLGLLGGAIFLVSLLVDDQYVDAKLESFYVSSPNIEVLSLGNSHGESLYFPVLNKSGFAFVRGGEDIYTTQRNFRIISSYTPKLRYVYMAIGPGYLGFNNASLFTLSAKDLPDISRNKNVSLEDAFFVFFAKFIYVPFFEVNALAKDVVKKGLISFLGRKKAVATSSCSSKHGEVVLEGHEFGVMGGYRAHALDSRCIEVSAKVSVDRQFSSVSNAIRANPSVWQENVNYVLSMADAMKKMDGKLLLVVPPFTKEYYESPKMQQLLILQAPYLQQLIAHPAIKFFDYHDFYYDSEYQSHNSYFADPSHLSLDGVKKYSKSLSAKLKVLEAY